MPELLKILMKILSRKTRMQTSRPAEAQSEKKSRNNGKTNLFLASFDGNDQLKNSLKKSLENPDEPKKTEIVSFCSTKAKIFEDKKRKMQAELRKVESSLLSPIVLEKIDFFQNTTLGELETNSTNKIRSKILTNVIQSY